MNQNELNYDRLMVTSIDPGPVEPIPFNPRFRVPNIELPINRSVENVKIDKEKKKIDKLQFGSILNNIQWLLKFAHTIICVCCTTSDLEIKIKSMESMNKFKEFVLYFLFIR